MRETIGWMGWTIVFTIAFAGPAGAWQSPAGIVGEWDLTIESPQGARTNLLVVTQEGDKLAAKVKSQRGERALDKFELKDKEVSFSMTIAFQGQEMLIAYKGTFESDAMKGEADFGGFASGAWSAVRHKEPAAGTVAAGTASGTVDVSGVWNFTVETAGGSGNPTFTLKQEGEGLSGTYEGILGKSDVTGSVKGGSIEIRFSADFQGQQFQVSYTGTVESNTAMKGTVRLADLGEGTWTAKKQ